MISYTLTRTARADIDEIWYYIARDSVENADRVEEAIYATCRLAAVNPVVGHERADFKKHNVHFLAVSPYKRYLIAYEVGTKPLTILRVIHGARNVPKLFKTGVV